MPELFKENQMKRLVLTLALWQMASLGLASGSFLPPPPPPPPSPEEEASDGADACAEDPESEECAGESD